MKKLLAILIAMAMMLLMVSAVSAEEDIISPDKIFYFYNSDTGINDEKLAEMVKSGVIPKDAQGLFFWDNHITDLMPLAELKDLKILVLRIDQIRDLTPLSSLTNMKAIQLYSYAEAQIERDFSPLAKLTDLVDLQLNCYNQIIDISFINELTNLESFVLSDCQISDLSPLAGLTNLEKLRLSDNQISDLTPLAELTNLEELSLRNNRISDLTPLKGLKNLKLLRVEGNEELSFRQIKALRVALPKCAITHSFHLLDVPPSDIFNALEVLKYLVGIDSDVILDGGIYPAYLITPESKANGEPTIFDALEILKSLVGIPSLVG